MIYSRLLFLLVCVSSSYNVTFAQSNTSVAKFSSLQGESRWRGIFELKPGIEIPFNFLIRGKSETDVRLYFLNGDEQFEAGTISTLSDSLVVSIDPFDNELVLQLKGNTLTGYLRKQDGKGTPIPVTAQRNRTDRFDSRQGTPAGILSGTYDIRFALRDGKEEKAVGLFTQEGNILKGTILKVTGDSRYLEGIVENNRFYLSSFIGSTPVLYQGTLNADHTISGEVIGARSAQPFTGRLDESAALPDPYSLTFLKEGYKKLDFRFPDSNGNSISLSDEKFKNKVVIVTIGGTWCPNCVDEAAFLAPWYKANKTRGVEIISLHYERSTEPGYVQKALQRFRDRHQIQYEQLIAGIADKQKVAASLPALNTFLSFPTTLFIRKDGTVAKIHTGFTGPATGIHYEKFIREFNAEVTLLLNEKIPF